MKYITMIITLIFVISILSFHSNAIEYEFEIGEKEADLQNDLSKLINSLPGDIKDKLIPINEESASDISQKYSFEFFLDFIKESFFQHLPNQLQTLSGMVGFILIISLLNKLNSTMNTLTPALNMCTGLTSFLAIFTTQQNVLSTTSVFLSTLSETMLLIVPIMESIYLLQGNYMLSAVTSTGINVMISFTENLFSNAIVPAVNISFLMAVVASVTQNKTMVFLSRTLRNIITFAIITIMTLMTFSLTLQISTSSAADNFTNRTVRFALGSYIPIVGGAVSETYSLIKGSISLIKNLAGTTAIVILLLLCAGPIISLALSRLVIYITTNLSGILGCDREENIFNEIGSNYTLLIAITIASVVMYIIAIAQFCKTVVMVT